MKIAYVYDAVYPWIKGGAEKRVYELAKRLVLRGHEVHWYGVGWWWPEEGQRDTELDGIKLHGICKPVELYDGERRSIKEAIYFAVVMFGKLRGENFDLVDCQGFPFFSCFTTKFNLLLRKSELVITLHEIWNDYWYEYLGKTGVFGKLTEKLMVNLTDKIITVSGKTKEDLKNLKPSENSVIIPNGIDFKQISGIDPAPEKSDVIFVGRLIKEKNVDLIIKSLVLVKQVFPNVRCLIIGDGPEKEHLESLTVDLHLKENVKFLGFLENYENIISYLKSSHVFTLPSTREGFGIVVLEANACGLPVVVVDHPMNAAKDLIKDGENGFICEISEKMMADKIIAGINGKEKMKDSCVEFASGYDWDKIVIELEKFYHAVLISR
ncbi:MAG: Trehalose synthase [Methanobacterium sp. PtaU1.Bin242]|nr:MAG: Trehalose synthase [Methanobacterium sp. PtaU1.Bin242]